MSYRRPPSTVLYVETIFGQAVESFPTHAVGDVILRSCRCQGGVLDEAKEELAATWRWLQDLLEDSGHEEVSTSSNRRAQWMNEAVDHGCGGEWGVGFESSSSRTESSAASYADQGALLRDMQDLLCDSAGVSDTVAIVGHDAVDRVPIHTQLLSRRSSHFATALRSPWRRSSLVLPSDDPDAFRDVLEFLYTGAVRLESNTGSAVRVASAAQFAAISELEDIALTHIGRALTPFNFSAYLKAALSLPGAAISDRLVRLLSQYAARFPASILTSSSVSDAPREVAFSLVKAIWLLLADDIDQYEQQSFAVEPAQERSLAVEGLLAWASRYGAYPDHQVASAALRRHPWPRVDTRRTPQANTLASILNAPGSDDAERAALTSVFTACCARTFAKRIEPLGLLPCNEVFRKYRRDALRMTAT